MARKIRILFVTHLFYPAIGGVELHIKHLSEELIKREYEVKVLTSNAYSTEAFFLEDKRRIEKAQETINGIQVVRLTFRTFGRGILNKLRSIACRVKFPFSDWLRLISFGPRNRRFIDKIMVYNPDVIYAAPLPTLNAYYAYKAAKRMKKPLIIIPSYHIFDPCSFYNKIFFKMMREADIVMAQSPMEKEYLAKEGAIDPENIIILPPLPLKEHQLESGRKNKIQIRKRYGIKESFIVLYLGQHGVHKKVNVVLEAMRYVWQHMDMQDVALVIAGGTTDNTDLLKKQASILEQTCNGKVYFIDNFPAEEKEDIFQMSDIFICLSEMESFGIVFVEALNCGVPVIASKNSVARYIVEESETGILVEPGTITEVAGAIIELLADEEMRKRFSKNARRKAAENYHPQRILDKWEDVIANVTTN
ncbi:MAG: glycosyltransferase [Candidatus Aminicenantes bacterium]|nr:glycosyltransferase [Candidatus Aminicenantes bacterium]NIM83393.1 glycosyltransferase [Candidatus Aminicenantes bacterium]NIN22785.1 glycosyltransferase [Candidatus Aminicenantes bacterium]NIN46519.1 glycosyltransferase [Candidatus Aminicenantes bacterium]NIN89424.1 glycosyltransferase [Candidatus Aminicenantes bacterium]